MSTKFGLNETSSCTACGKQSEYNCERCGDFYCSPECQLKDWGNHRFICFPMPKLVKAGHNLVTKNIPTLKTNEKKSPENKNSFKCVNSQEKIPDGSCVFLTAFKSSNRCFIRSTNPSSVAEREKILKEIHEFGKKAPVLQSRTKTNFPVLALRNEKWCRAYVLKVKDNVCTITFTDFGDKHRYVNQLRKSDSYINNLPCYTQMVQLKELRNCSSDQKIIDSLNQYANMEYKIKYGRDTVELFKWGTSISLKDLIKELVNNLNDNGKENEFTVSSSPNLTEKIDSDKFENKNNISQPTNELDKKHQSTVETVAPGQTQKPCLTAPFDTIHLTEKDSGCNCLVMDNSFLECGWIGCLLEKYCENLKAVTESLNNFDVGHEPYKPQYNEYCLAKFDDIWYRAKVVEVLSDDKFLVVYIDFTNENELSSKYIRPYPLTLDFACCTTLCGIDGLPDDISKELKEYLEERLHPFSAIKIDSIRMKNNICYLKSNDLLEKLRNSNLI